MDSRKHHSARQLLSALGVIVLLAGCGNTGMAGPPSGGPVSAAPTAPATPAVGPHNQADVTFTAMMIPHHRQAVTMSDLIVAKPGLDPQITDLANRIKTAQAPEISRMSGWLVGWNGGPSSSSFTADMGAINGMMSQADLDTLQKASSDEAARLYLTGMIRHHQGAVAMARTELTSGQNAGAKQLAATIVSTQATTAPDSVSG